MKALGSIQIGAKTYRVRAVPAGHKSLDGARGLMDPNRHTITIDEDPSHMLDSLIHEVTHALIYECGLGEMLFAHLPTEEERSKAEEHFVLLLTPHVLAILSQLRGVAWSRRLKHAWPKKGKK